jgi:hypothetical protein
MDGVSMLTDYRITKQKHENGVMGSVRYLPTDEIVMGYYHPISEELFDGLANDAILKDEERRNRTDCMECKAQLKRSEVSICDACADALYDEHLQDQYESTEYYLYSRYGVG